MARQPCVVCAEDTAPGSALYASRTVIERTASRGYVCGDCRARSSPGRRRALGREELARLNESAVVFGAWWSGGPGGGT